MGHVIMDENQYPKLLSIDPGSTYLGISVFEFDPRTVDIVSIHSFTLDATKLDIDPDRIEAIGLRPARIARLMLALEGILYIYKPNVVVCEDAFWNPGRPSAFEPLVECISGVRMTCQRYQPLMTVGMIRASVAKNAIGVSGGASKTPILQGLMAIKEIVKTTQEPLNTLSEHAHDAIAIGYCALMKIRKGDSLKPPPVVKKVKKITPVKRKKK